MANNFSNINDAAGVIAKAAAAMLADELQFTKSIATAEASDYKGKNGYSNGDTVYVSKPARFIPQETFDITSSMQDIVEEEVPLTLDVSSTVGVNVTSTEMATDVQVKSLIKRLIKPAVSAIAQNVEQRFLEKATDATFNVVGTAGSTSFDTDTILSAREKMNKFLCPKDADRFFLQDSTAGRAAVNARKGLFQSASDIAKQYKMGYVGTADGFNWMENELLTTHTNGNDVTSVLVNGATATGATTLAIDGLTTTTGTVKKGQVFTLAGVFAVHPITRAVYPFLQQFVVTADATANGSGEATVGISPAIHAASGVASLQNVSALPADNAALTFVGAADGAYTQNLAFHKNAFRKVSVPLVMPTQAEFAAQETVNGITVAIVRDFDITTRKMITRLDFLGGLVADRPEWACRVTS